RLSPVPDRRAGRALGPHPASGGARLRPRRGRRALHPPGPCPPPRRGLGSLLVTAPSRPEARYLAASDFPFTRLLEDAHAEIRRELDAVPEGAFVDWPERFLHGQGWTVFGLHA